MLGSATIRHESDNHYWNRNRWAFDDLKQRAKSFGFKWLRVIGRFRRRKIRQMKGKRLKNERRKKQKKKNGTVYDTLQHLNEENFLSRIFVNTIICTLNLSLLCNTVSKQKERKRNKRRETKHEYYKMKQNDQKLTKIRFWLKHNWQHW